MDIGCSKRDQGQIQSKGTKGEEVEKVYWLFLVGDHLPFSSNIFQMAWNLMLQEDIRENRDFWVFNRF